MACEFLQEALARASREVTVNLSDAKALEEDLGRYELLIYDIRMPQMDGLKFLGQFHQRFPHLPVILVTAFGSLETTMEALRLVA